MVYYKNLLVISDNLPIVQAFDAILESKGLKKSVQVRYVHSPASRLGLLQPLTKSATASDDVINLKDPVEVDKIVQQHDLVFSVHCKQLFPDKLFRELKCLNVHPGYNPLNRGWFPQVFAIIHHYDLGATIHEINGELDNGPIIAREKVPLYDWDTSLTAYNRVVEKEIELLNKNIVSIIHNQYTTISSDSLSDEEQHLFTKKDFNKLLTLDLNETGSFGDFLNRLRALTHGDYKNAYFLTQEGKKVFVSVNLEVSES